MIRLECLITNHHYPHPATALTRGLLSDSPHPTADRTPGPDGIKNRAIIQLPGKPVNLDLDGFRRRITPPPVPCTGIYTRTDGIVAWQCSLEPEGALTDNVEVRGSHMGLPFNPEVARAIAERLALPV